MLFCASSAAPAWRSACTMAASRGAGGSPASTREPACVTQPATSKQAFTPSVAPARGGGATPAHSKASRARASANAA